MNSSRRDFLATAGLTLAALQLNLALASDEQPKAYAVIYGAENVASIELYDERHQLLGRTANGCFSYRQHIRRFPGAKTSCFEAGDNYVSLDDGKEYLGLGLFSFKDHAEYRRELEAGRLVLKRKGDIHARLVQAHGSVS